MAIVLNKRNLAALVLVVVVAVTGSAAQSVPACASKLASCADYLNATKPPPETCCGPLKEAVKNELPCLCSLFNSPDLLKAFNINLTQALALPKNCGVKSADQNICSKSGSTGAAPPSSSKPAAPSGGSSSKDKNESNGAFGGPVWVGMPALLTVLFLGWSIAAS